MDCGKITRTGSDISSDEWKNLIDTEQQIIHMPDRVGTNPFTQERMVFSGKDKAYYQENGVSVGNIVLESGELMTTGVPRQFCERLASALGGLVLEDDRS